MLSIVILACVLENGAQSCATTSPPPGFFVAAPNGLFVAEDRDECERLAGLTANFVLNQLLIRGYEVTRVDGACVGGQDA